MGANENAEFSSNEITGNTRDKRMRNGQKAIAFLKRNNRLTKWNVQNRAQLIIFYCKLSFEVQIVIRTAKYH